jgi:hypothetical protein
VAHSATPNYVLLGNMGSIKMYCVVLRLSAVTNDKCLVQKNTASKPLALRVLLKLVKKKASPNVSNNLGVEPEVVEHTSGRATQEPSQTSHPSLPGGEECIAVSDNAVSNLLLDSGPDSDECGWNGTVNHVAISESDSDSDFEPSSSTDAAVIPTRSLTRIMKSRTWKEKSC